MATAGSSTAEISDDAELKLFCDAISDVIKDEGFHLKTPQASAAFEAASSLMEWSKDTVNNARMSLFSKTLVQHLRDCLPAEMDRVKMWRNFHVFRSSKDYFILWNKFLKESIKKGGPIFFQYVTSQMFQQIAKQHYPVAAQEAEAVHDQDFTSIEMNALRYAAGYIPRNLLPKIARSSHRNKESLRMCLLDVIEEDGLGEEESEEWMKLVDRGGLKNVTSQMFKFVCAMEMVMRALFRKEEKPRDVKSEALMQIKSSEAVDGEWRTLSAEWEPEEAQILFDLMTTLWVTMRGFSYASTWMETWKAEKKKTVQKSQALRKTLNKQ